MILISSPCAIYSPKILSSSSSGSTIRSQYIFRSRGQQALTQTSNASYDFRSPFVNTASSQRSRSLLQVSFATKSSGPGEDDHRALEAVLRLYSAIKQRNLRELSDVIGDECRCVCNFISSFHPFHGKRQVLELFSFLMRYMGENIEFVVQPTLQGGMQVAVRWKLEWSKTHVPIGMGFSFYTCHTYQGKVVISDMEMFMEPLHNLEPLRLKLMGLVMTVLDKIGSHSIIKGKGKKNMYFFLSMVIIVALICWLRLTLFSAY